MPQAKKVKANKKTSWPFSLGGDVVGTHVEEIGCRPEEEDILPPFFVMNYKMSLLNLAYIYFVGVVVACE